MEIGYLGAEAGLDDASVYALLQDLDSRLGKYVHRSDRHLRLSEIIERARRKHPYGLDNVEFNGLFGAPVEESPKLLFNWRELIESKVKIEWQLEGLLSKLGHLILAGDSGVGKTQIGIRLALSLVFGRNWLKWPNLVGPQRVLFLSLEMNHPSIKYFIETMDSDLAYDEKLALAERFVAAPLGEEIPVEKEQGRNFLDTLMQEARPDCVIIDSMGKLTDQPLKEEGVAKGLDKWLVGFRKKYNVSTVVIHHNRKTDGPKSLETMYGSVYVGAYADTVLGFSHHDPKDKTTGLINVDCMKARLCPQWPQFIVERTPTLDFFIVEPEDLTKPDRRLSTMLNGGFFGDLAP